MYLKINNLTLFVVAGNNTNKLKSNSVKYINIIIMVHVLQTQNLCLYMT